MSFNTKSIGFQFNITSPTQHQGVPEEKDVVNQFDFAGDLVSLKRIDGESNVNYRNRIMDTCVNRGDSTYGGVVNNLSRELGVLRKTAFTVSLKTDSSGYNFASNPRFDIFANKVVLYSDWRPDGTATIDKTINFYKPTDDGFYIEDLVSEINESSYFLATIDSNIRPNTHSSSLIKATSSYRVVRDPIRSDNITFLSSDNIVENSVVFSEDTIFRTEVLTTPSSEGEYKVNYSTGSVEVYSIPKGEEWITYYTATFPLTVEYSPIIVYTLQDNDFVDELYQKKTLQSGEEVKTLLNAEGSEIIHQLFEETEMFWGE